MRKNRVIQKRSTYLRSRSMRKPKMTEMHRRELIRKIRIFLVSLMGVSILGVTLFFLFFSSYTEIQDKQIVGDSQTVTQEEIVSVIDGYTEEKQGYIILKKNFFFFSSAEMQRRLEERFLTLSDIRVEKQFPHTIRVSFLERKKIGYWCARQLCFGIDASGYTFENADFESVRMNNEKVYPVFVDDSYQEAALRKIVIDKGVLERFIEWEIFFKTRLENQFSSTYFVQPKGLSEYLIRTQQDWELRVKNESSLPETMRSFLAFLETLPVERKQQLESIDLRVEGKIFFTERPSETLDEEGEEKTEDDVSKVEEI